MKGTNIRNLIRAIKAKRETKNDYEPNDIRHLVENAKKFDSKKSPLIDGEGTLKRLVKKIK